MQNMRKVIMLRNVIVPPILENTLCNKLLIISHKLVKKVEIDEKKRMSVRNERAGNHLAISGKRKIKLIAPTIKTIIKGNTLSITDFSLCFDD